MKYGYSPRKYGYNPRKYGYTPRKYGYTPRKYGYNPRKSLHWLRLARLPGSTCSVGAAKLEKIDCSSEPKETISAYFLLC